MYIMVAPILLLVMAIFIQLPSSLVAALSVNGDCGASHAHAIVSEVHPNHITQVSHLVSSALEIEDEDTPSRYTSIRNAVNDFQADTDSIPANELVYGELSVPVLSTILDAVGVRKDDVFLDIGSGDGALVLGASLLYASSYCNDVFHDDIIKSDGDNRDEDTMINVSRRRETNAIRKCFGVDIIPGLVERSKLHTQNLKQLLHYEDDVQSPNGNANTIDVSNLEILRQNQAEVEFVLGDIHKPDSELQRMLKETTVAVCFATTWSAGNAHNNENHGNNGSGAKTSLQGRMLPKLSNALSLGLRKGCRVVIIDGKLNEEDGFENKGDLRVQCPDTAPYSVATLYHVE